MDLSYRPVNPILASPTTRTIRMDHPLRRHTALLLFAAVVLSWGLNWAVTKTIVHSVFPLWAGVIRQAIGAAVLLVLLLARGELAVPRRGDMPVICTIALLH